MRLYQTAILFSSVLLCGCADGALGVRDSPAWHMTASAEAKTAVFKERCEGYGFDENSEAMKYCMAEESRMSRGRASDSMSDALDDLNRDYQSNNNVSSNRDSYADERNRECIMQGKGAYIRGVGCSQTYYDAQRAKRNKLY